jgi:hypothetical protein
MHRRAWRLLPFHYFCDACFTCAAIIKLFAVSYAHVCMWASRLTGVSLRADTYTCSGTSCWSYPVGAQDIFSRKIHPRTARPGRGCTVERPKRQVKSASMILRFTLLLDNMKRKRDRQDVEQDGVDKWTHHVNAPFFTFPGIPIGISPPAPPHAPRFPPAFYLSDLPWCRLCRFFRLCLSCEHSASIDCTRLAAL